MRIRRSDITQLPKNFALIELLDADKAAVEATHAAVGSGSRSAGSGLFGSPGGDGPQWHCDLERVVTEAGEPLPVGRLKLRVEWPSFEGDVCLFIPVIDKSGSMAGNAFRQVQDSLMHMLECTLANRSVFTAIVPYSSSAEVLKVPRDGTADTARWQATKNSIRTMRAGGGTRFEAAFKKISDVLYGDISGGKIRAKA